MLRSLGVRLVLAVLLGLSGAVACGSKQAPPPSPTVETTRHLQGTWQLVRFTPEKPLGEPFQGLLDAQLKTLTVTFDAGTFTANGPGVETRGSYAVTNAIGDQFSATITDAAGESYPISVQLKGDKLDFVSHNERWRGKGSLERAKAQK